MSNNEELVEVCQPVNQIEAEFVRLLLGSKGISCVFKSGYRTIIMVVESVAKKAKKIIKREGLCLNG